MSIIHWNDLHIFEYYLLKSLIQYIITRYDDVTCHVDRERWSLCPIKVRYTVHCTGFGTTFRRLSRGAVCSDRLAANRPLVSIRKGACRRVVQADTWKWRFLCGLSISLCARSRRCAVHSWALSPASHYLILSTLSSLVIVL